MKLVLSNASGVPIYEQIKQQIKAAILAGELREGEALPSLRSLAKDLKISVLTVTRAYTELEQEGFVQNVQGRGCFALGRGSELIKEQLIVRAENHLAEAIQAAKWRIYPRKTCAGCWIFCGREMRMIYDLEIRNLSKSFGGFALRNVSFALPKGYIMGLIGPNGSGKTTTIQLILNMLRRDGGAIKVLGRDILDQERAIKASLGVVFDSSCFSDDWRAAQVEQAISPFYANWNRDTFAQIAAQIPH